MSDVTSNILSIFKFLIFKSNCFNEVLKLDLSTRSSFYEIEQYFAEHKLKELRNFALPAATNYAFLNIIFNFISGNNIRSVFKFQFPFFQILRHFYRLKLDLQLNLELIW